MTKEEILEALLNATPEMLEVLTRILMDNQQPTEADQEAPEPKHFIRISKSIEEMEADRKEFEATAGGSKFIAALKNAKDFYLKNGNPKNSLGCSELAYLANLHHGSLINGSFDLYALAYRSGYNTAKKKLSADKKKEA